MVTPLNEDTASVKRWFSSCSSSSSDHNCNGFFAPPASTFLVTKRHIVSKSRFLAVPPGGESKYCLTSTDENPPTPPKYPNTRSTNSAVWGMLLPPATVEAQNRSTPAASILSSAAFWRALARNSAFCFSLAMQARHSAVK